MRIDSLLGAILVLATTVVAGQTATGIRLIDVQFKGIRRLEGVDLSKCAADLKSRTYEGPGQGLDQIRSTYMVRGYPDSTMIPNTNIDDSRHVISMVFDCDEGKQVH
jgi:hypothetical protein